MPDRDFKHHNSLNIIMPILQLATLYLIGYSLLSEHSWDKCECITLVNNASSKMQTILKSMFSLTASNIHIMENIKEIIYLKVSHVKLVSNKW